MPSSRSRPRWWFLITPRWLAWHAFAVLAATGLLWLGDWQFRRAEGGNALSWAYTFEWPIFTIFGVVFWAKTIADEFKTRGAEADGAPVAAPGSAVGLALPATALAAAGTDDVDDEDDPELAAYNAYLSGLAAGRQTGRFQGATGGAPG